MSAFHNSSGEVQQYTPALEDYREAADAGLSLPALYASKTGVKDAFFQMCASEGIFVKGDKDLGIAPSTLGDVMNPKASISKDAVPTSRILAPAIIKAAVEDKLKVNRRIAHDAFEGMIAVDDSISGERYEHPVINMSRPEQARGRTISQNALPQVMLSITTSDKAYTIGNQSIGMELSHQAMKATTLDLIALAIARQSEVQMNETAQGYMLALLNGDIDNGEESLASLGFSKTVAQFDPTAAAGTFTQQAWLKFLIDRSTSMTKTHLVMDYDTAVKLDARVGKPLTINGEDKGALFNATFNVMNQAWKQQPNVFITQDAAWPAGTVMAFDSRYAIRRVRSVTMSYNATADLVMQRTHQLRMDLGEHVNRLHADAFSCLTLA